VSEELNVRNPPKPDPLKPDQQRLTPEETQMNARSPQPETAENLYDDYDEGFGQQLPPRPRFRFLSPLTAALTALIVGGVGFFVGIRVEKSKVGSTGGTSAFASRFAAGGAPGTSTTGGSSSRTGGFGAGAGAGGFASLFGRGGAGTTGSVTAVDGDTLYVQESSGDTVKVKLTGSTTVTKSESVSKKKIYPGDEVTITGPAGSSGTVTATAVTDSGTGGSTTAAGGAGGSSSTGSASTGSTGSTSASSANSSLFGG